MATAALPQSAYAQCAAHGLVIFDTMMEIIELQKIAATRPLTESESSRKKRLTLYTQRYQKCSLTHWKQARNHERIDARVEAEFAAEMADATT